jgi:hypothetical protein
MPVTAVEHQSVAILGAYFEARSVAALNCSPMTGEGMETRVPQKRTFIYNPSYRFPLGAASRSALEGFPILAATHVSVKSIAVGT